MGHIVEFPLRMPEADVFSHDDMARLYAAWRQSAQTGKLPPLRDFAPRRLGQWIAWSAIAETAATTHDALMDGAVMRWRLAGSALCRLAGHELTRRLVFEDWQQFERATLTRLLGQTIFNRQAFLARLQMTGADITEAGLEMLSLPLHDVARGRDVGLVVFRPHFPPEMVVPATLASARLVSLRTLESGNALATRPMVTEEDNGMALDAKVLPLFSPAP